ncbi:glycosyltransferase family 4 protein [Alphaproteobacteria bacterium]|nr:glycosyltransferase family 4 protein [Alphaproteobacteria bacterium]
MKITIISHYFWPDNYRINLFASELIKKGMTVEVITSSPMDNSLNSGIFKNIIIHRIKNRRVKNHRNYEIILNYLTFYFNALIFIFLKRKKLKVSNIFVFQPSPIFIGLIGVFLKKFTKSRMFIWVLDLWPQTIFNHNIVREKSIFGKILIKISKIIYSNSEIIYQHCETFENEIRKYSDDKKIIYLPSSAEDVFENNTIKNLNSKKIKILFAGNIGRSQDFDMIVKVLSLKQFSNIKLNIIGDGRGVTNLKKLVLKNKNKNITILNRVSINKVTDYYKDSDFFFITLKDFEIFKLTIPGKFQSYLRFSKPILGIIDGVTKNIINDNECGFAINNNDENGLKTIFEKLKKMKQMEYEILCKNSKKLYNLKYDIHKNMRKFIKSLSL